MVSQLLQLFMASQDGGIQQFACTLLVRPINTDLSSLHRVLLLKRHFKLVVQLLLIFIYLHLNDLIVQELIIGSLSWLGLRTHRAFVSIFYSIIINLITDEDRIDSLLCFGQFFNVFLEIVFGIDWFLNFVLYFVKCLAVELSSWMGLIQQMESVVVALCLIERFDFSSCLWCRVSKSECSRISSGWVGWKVTLHEFVALALNDRELFTPVGLALKSWADWLMLLLKCCGVWLDAHL